jgi:ABC-three component (ABC-3C) system Middle Component 6
MLLPDNIHPEDSVYYNGAFVLQAVKINRNSDLLDIYQHTKQLKEMSMPIFILCLDWLFLLDLLSLDDQGRIELCI